MEFVRVRKWGTKRVFTHCITQRTGQLRMGSTLGEGGCWQHCCRLLLRRRWKCWKHYSVRNFSTKSATSAGFLKKALATLNCVGADETIVDLHGCCWFAEFCWHFIIGFWRSLLWSRYLKKSMVISPSSEGGKRTELSWARLTAKYKFHIASDKLWGFCEYGCCRKAQHQQN